MPLDVLRVKALCFDIDGTLCDTDDQLVLQLARWLSVTRFILPRHDALRSARRLVMFTEGPGNWLYSLADRLGLDAQLEALGDRFVDLGIAKSAQPYRLVSGILVMLDNLASHYPMAIISTRGHKATYRFMEQSNLTPYFRAIITGQSCSHTKPYPDPVIRAAGLLGVTPGSCLMVGDTVVDILSGKRAGAQTVGVLCGFGERSELYHAGADLLVESTPDLLNHLVLS